MYEKPRVNVKVERGSTFTFTRGFSYITSILIYARKASSSLRPYARKNYATVEIHLYSRHTLVATVVADSSHNLVYRDVEMSMQ